MRRPLLVDWTGQVLYEGIRVNTCQEIAANRSEFEYKPYRPLKGKKIFDEVREGKLVCWGVDGEGFWSQWLLRLWWLAVSAKDHHKSQNHSLVVDSLRGGSRQFSSHMARKVALVSTDSKKQTAVACHLHMSFAPMSTKQNNHVENVYLPDSTLPPGRLTPVCWCAYLPNPWFQCHNRGRVLMQSRHWTETAWCRRQMVDNAMHNTWWCTCVRVFQELL